MNTYNQESFIKVANQENAQKDIQRYKQLIEIDRWDRQDYQKFRDRGKNLRKDDSRDIIFSFQEVYKLYHKLYNGDTQFDKNIYSIPFVISR